MQIIEIAWVEWTIPQSAAPFLLFSCAVDCFFVIIETFLIFPIALPIIEKTNEYE